MHRSALVNVITRRLWTSSTCWVSLSQVYFYSNLSGLTLIVLQRMLWWWWLRYPGSASFPTFILKRICRMRSSTRRSTNSSLFCSTLETTISPSSVCHLHCHKRKKPGTYLTTKRWVFRALRTGRLSFSTFWAQKLYPRWSFTVSANSDALRQSWPIWLSQGRHCAQNKSKFFTARQRRQTISRSRSTLILPNFNNEPSIGRFRSRTSNSKNKSILMWSVRYRKIFCM